MFDIIKRAIASVVTVLLLIVIVPIFIAGIASILSGRNAGDLSVGGTNKIAVIELEGEIYSSKETLDKLYKQANNDDVVGIVLRIDSPGGAVGPSQEIYNAVKNLKARKPIVASLGSIAASGGFYSALGASKILCQPGTLAGSIGVIVQFPNFRKIADKVGVEVSTFASGSFKDAGNPFGELSQDERDYFQQTVSAVNEQFIAAVAEGRGLPLEEARGVADGRIIIGSEALERKLVDGYGDVYAAAREALRLANIEISDNELPNIFYVEDRFRKVTKWLDSITENRYLSGHSLIYALAR